MKLSSQRMKILKLLYQERVQRPLPTLSVEKIASELQIPRNEAWNELTYLEESGLVAIRSKQLGARLVYTLAITARGIDLVEASAPLEVPLGSQGELVVESERTEDGIVKLAEVSSKSQQPEADLDVRSMLPDAIFISHSHHDNYFCRRLVAALRHSFPEANIFYDESELRGGDDFVRRIPGELMKRPIFIVVVSDRSVISPWVQEETNIALREAITDQRRRVIPLLYREGDMDMLNPLLRSRQIIDCAYQDESLGFAQLVSVLQLLPRIGDKA
jgi:TIR domain-containing protein